jgi:hypothetical protein
MQFDKDLQDVLSLLMQQQNIVLLKEKCTLPAAIA